MWFDNLPTSTELQGFYYYQGKNTKVATVQFSHTQPRQQQTLITKTVFSTSYAQDLQWTTKRAKKPAWAYRPKPPLHGLSLKKSLIKKPRNIIQVKSSRQPNQTQQGSTKPNTYS